MSKNVFIEGSIRPELIDCIYPCERPIARLNVYSEIPFFYFFSVILFLIKVEKSFSSLIDDTSYIYFRGFKIFLFDFKYLFDNKKAKKYTINT